MGVFNSLKFYIWSVNALKEKGYIKFNHFTFYFKWWRRQNGQVLANANIGHHILSDVYNKKPEISEVLFRAFYFE
jgi:hypothetical protein